MSSNEKVSNVLGDSKQELVTTPFSEKKSLTKDVEKGTDKLADILLMENKYSTRDVDKGTDELADMKQAANKIHRKGQDQFEGQSSGSKGWFKLDIVFFKQFFPRVIQNHIKTCLKIILKINTWKCIKCLLYCLINN